MQEDVAPIRKKRPYKRRNKQAQQQHSNTTTAAAAAIATAASFGEVDILHHDMESSDEDLLSPVRTVLMIFNESLFFHIAKGKHCSKMFRNLYLNTKYDRVYVNLKQIT